MKILISLQKKSQKSNEYCYILQESYNKASFYSEKTKFIELDGGLPFMNKCQINKDINENKFIHIINF